MWTYNKFPKDKVKAKYGFTPDDKWLEHARLSSARLAGGCSASFVSENGLVMTNHHCAHSCIEQLSTSQRDYVQSGFYAKTQGDEVMCPEIEVNQLVEISDVTDRLKLATKGLDDKKFNEAQKAEMSKIEKACQTSDKYRCDVVSLYHGGVYNLYKYRRFQDVRLVFAPEFKIAFFGGDPDNFMFPRYDLDVSFLRVYDEGKPAHMDHYFKWSQAGAAESELTFVSGHPGGTDRQLTVAQLEYQRDVAMPDRLLRLAEFRGMLNEFAKRGPEQKRISDTLLFGVENSFKAIKGRYQALLEPGFFAQKVAAEKSFRAKLAKSADKQKKYGAAFDAIAKEEALLKDMRKGYAYREQAAGLRSELFGIGRTLVRAGDERPKPSEKRLREFRESALPSITQGLFSKAPIYDELEIALLSFSLTKMREDLGADDPFVKKVLGRESPDEMATRLIKTTKLKDVALRKQLWEGGKAAVDASSDPMIKLAKLIDADGRAIRTTYEEQIEGPMKKNSELVAKAHFDVEGMNSYPDATFTLRLSYGQVKGYPENGKQVAPFTTFAGAFDRATGRDPFALPKSWIDAKNKLTPDTPFNFVTTNDIIGGNSGSPVINKNAEIVGLIFDGNIQSLGGDFGFDETVNRAVSVHSQALLHALAKIYGADRIVNELRPQLGATAPATKRSHAASP
jgi:hypothetical protein